MPGMYYDKDLASPDTTPPDDRWRGHQLPRDPGVTPGEDDPGPGHSSIRVCAGGRWMSWDEWIASPAHCSRLETAVEPPSVVNQSRPPQKRRLYHRSQKAKKHRDEIGAEPLFELQSDESPDTINPSSHDNDLRKSKE